MEKIYIQITLFQMINPYITLKSDVNTLPGAKHIVKQRN